jgi:hypothetical protein
VALKLDMEKPMEGHDSVVLTLQPNGGATEVSWTMAWPYPYINRVSMADAPNQLNGEMKMRCMVIVKASKDSEKGVMPSAELLSAMGKYNEELIEAGIMQGGGGLKPTSLGKRVRFSGAQRSVVHGPFSPTEEQIAGYWIWEVKSVDEAIEWLKRCPNPMPVDSEIEIRPEYEAADFAP